MAGMIRQHTASDRFVRQRRDRALLRRLSPGPDMADGARWLEQEASRIRHRRLPDPVPHRHSPARFKTDLDIREGPCRRNSRRAAKRWARRCGRSMSRPPAGRVYFIMGLMANARGGRGALHLEDLGNDGRLDHGGGSQTRRAAGADCKTDDSAPNRSVSDGGVRTIYMHRHCNETCNGPA